MALRWAGHPNHATPGHRSYRGGVEVKLFGEFEVVRGGVAIPVRGAKQRALLALLALNRGNPVSADRLIDQLWGEGQTAKPANALQAQIAQLRRTLGASAIVTSESGYALDISAADLDAARFEDLVAEGRRLRAEGEVARASAVLGDALRLRRGEPLSEFAYAGFADAERAHLNELALVATEYRVEADLELGHHNELVGELEALCRDHPLRERLWELLMLALYRAGRQAEALRAYTEIRDRLVDELGVDPGSGLRELEARVLDHDPSLVAEQTAAPLAPTLQSMPGNLPEPWADSLAVTPNWNRLATPLTRAAWSRSSDPVGWERPVLRSRPRPVCGNDTRVASG